MSRKKFIKKHIKKSKQNTTEPEIKQFNKEEFIRVLNWYNSYKVTEKTKKNWVIEYIDNKELLKLNEDLFTHPLSTICRLANRGLNIDEHKQWLDNKIKFLLTRIKTKPTKKANIDTRTIQDKILDQANIVMAEIDFFVDEKMTENIEHKITPLLSKNNFSRQHIRHLINHIDSYISEFIYMLTEKDLKVAYRIPKNELDSLLKYLSALKKECEKWTIAKKIISKQTRKVSTKTPTELCKLVKISDNTSVIPQKIINNSYSVLYNTKYHKVTFLVSNGDGLSIRGTTIVDFNEKKSAVYSVKKKHICEFKDGFKTMKGQRVIKKFLECEMFNISKAKPTGRLSELVEILI